MEATEHHFPVMLLAMLNKVVQILTEKWWSRQPFHIADRMCTTKKEQ